MPASSPDDANAFIAKWSGSTLSERATFASFATEPCALLGIAVPISPVGLAKRFARAKASDVREILQTLTTLGLAHPGDQPDTWLI